MPEIIVPERMRKFPVHHGYPVFYVVSRNHEGIPQWKTLDRNRQIECCNKNLCHLCGERMINGRFWFIVGPEEWEGNQTSNGPMHEECARYACVKCPYLANASYRGSKDILDHCTNPLAAKWLIEHDMTGELKRPDRIALCSALSYSSDTSERYIWFFVKHWDTTDWNVMPKKIPESCPETGASNV